MKEYILKSIHEGLDALHQLKEHQSLVFIENVTSVLAECFKKHNKVLIAGNGGSLCDASHFAEELTGQFRTFRPALSAIALNDPGHITCTGNDMGFDKIFARALEAHGRKGDVFIGLTTSGNSPNIIKAFEVAKTIGLKTVAFLGKEGGKLKGCADLELIISGFSTSDRIQEAHMTAIHIIIEMLEKQLFEKI